MTLVVMERSFDVAPTEAELADMKDRTQTCLEINDARRIQTYASPDLKRFVCVFEGRDLTSVRRAIDSAGIEYERLWSATAF